MKKNYTFKTISKGLAVAALALSSTLATAQVATDYVAVLRTTTTTAYPDGSANIISPEIMLEGTTFKIQAVVTPQGNSTYVESNGNNRWGVGTSGTPVNANDGSLFEGDEVDSALITSITVIDFNAGTTGYTVSAISNLHFDGMTIFAASGGFDNPVITVNGTNPGPFTLGQLANNAESFKFGVPFSNAASASFTVGGTDDVTSITLATGSSDFRNAWQIIGTDVSYTFTTDPLLSVDDFGKSTASSFKLYPNPATSEVALNLPIISAQILDVTGKVVKKYSGQIENLDVSELARGLYILKGMSTEGVQLTSKFIKK